MRQLNCMFIMYFSLVDSHTDEMQARQAGSQPKPTDWIKDALKRYVALFWPAARLLQENIDKTVYDHRGDFDGSTYEEMWTMYTNHKAGRADSEKERKRNEAASKEVCRWNDPKKKIHCLQMKLFREYILQRDRTSSLSDNTDDAALVASLEAVEQAAGEFIT